MIIQYKKLFVKSIKESSLNRSNCSFKNHFESHLRVNRIKIWNLSERRWPRGCSSIRSLTILRWKIGNGSFWLLRRSMKWFFSISFTISLVRRLHGNVQKNNRNGDPAGGCYITLRMEHWKVKLVFRNELVKQFRKNIATWILT